jgi:hypothetical protein
MQPNEVQKGVAARKITSIEKEVYLKSRRKEKECIWRWYPSGTLRPYDGGNKHLRNVGQLLRDYTAPYSRKLSSTY